jgi:predicted HicB family RNase H-like nuclease
VRHKKVRRKKQAPNKYLVHPTWDRAFNFRMSTALHRKLKRSARKDNISLNREMNNRLEASFTEGEQ